MRASAGVIALSVVLSGCLDLVTPPAEEALVSITIRLSDSRSRDEHSVDGVFLPGRDASGRMREAPDPSILVGGLTVAPIGIDQLGRYLYRQDLPFDPDSFAARALLVEPPSLPSLPEVPPAVRTRTVWRVGSDTVALPAGQDLTLGLSVPSLDESIPPEDERWSLALVDGQGFSLQLTFSGAVPPSIEVPWSLFGEQATGELRALVRVTRLDSRTSADGQYLHFVFVVVGIEWQVEITGT